MQKDGALPAPYDSDPQFLRIKHLNFRIFLLKIVCISLFYIQHLHPNHLVTGTRVDLHKSLSVDVRFSFQLKTLSDYVFSSLHLIFL